MCLYIFVWVSGQVFGWKENRESLGDTGRWLMFCEKLSNGLKRLAPFHQIMSEPVFTPFIDPSAAESPEVWAEVSQWFAAGKPSICFGILTSVFMSLAALGLFENGGKTLGKPRKPSKTHSLENHVHISDVNHFVKSRKGIILQFWTSKCTIQSTQNVKKRDLVKSFHSHLHWWSQFCSYTYIYFCNCSKRQVFCSWCHRPICLRFRQQTSNGLRAGLIQRSERAFPRPELPVGQSQLKITGARRRWHYDASSAGPGRPGDFKMLSSILKSKMKFMWNFFKQILASGPIDHHGSTFIQPQLVHCSLLWHLHHPRPGPCRMRGGSWSLGTSWATPRCRMVYDGPVFIMINGFCMILWFIRLSWCIMVDHWIMVHQFPIVSPLNSCHCSHKGGPPMVSPSRPGALWRSPRFPSFKSGPL